MVRIEECKPEHLASLDPRANELNACLVLQRQGFHEVKQVRIINHQIWIYTIELSAQRREALLKFCEGWQ